METPPDSEKPGFTIDEPVILRLAILRDGIESDTTSYQKAMDVIIDENQTGTPVYGPYPEAVETAITQLKTFFDERDDLHVTYDDATDEALSNQRFYTMLIAEMKRHRPIVRKSGQRIRHEENLAAVVARDKVRIYTLGFYITRMAEWQAHQIERVTEQSTEPEILTAG